MNNQQQSDNINYDYIIIGSGFGGSVSALRLAEKGYSVLVIEKGKRYQPQDFPKTNWNLRKYLWLPSLFLYGIQKITFLKDVLVLHGTGVGGGSLVYANTHLSPPANVYQDARWTDSNWKSRLEPVYALARKMLGTVTVKHIAESDRLLQELDAESKGKSSFYSVDAGVFFGEPDVTVADPYFDGKGPDRTGCNFCGNCMVGCRFNAKNTLDRNYLYLAEQLGAEILPETEVTDILQMQNKSYRIITKKSTGIFHTKKEITCNNIVMAAGVLGTVKLLMSCLQRGSLSKLSNCLGQYVRTNSEAIVGTRTGRKFRKNLNNGVAISAGYYPEKDTHIEAVRFGKGNGALSFLTTFMVSRRGNAPQVIKWFAAFIKQPLKVLKAMNPIGWASSSIILLVMQPKSNYLKLKFERRWWRFGKHTINSSLSAAGNIPSSIPAGDDAAKKLARITDGVPMTTVTDTLFNIPTTAHILGGCIIGKDEKSGVVNSQGEVFNYPGMYITDGSIIPVNLGVNPSLTITAMAEYVMSQIEKKVTSTNLR